MMTWLPPLVNKRKCKTQNWQRWFRPHVEQLEDRLAPATLVPLSQSDNASAFSASTMTDPFTQETSTETDGNSFTSTIGDNEETHAIGQTTGLGMFGTGGRGHGPATFLPEASSGTYWVWGAVQADHYGDPGPPDGFPTYDVAWGNAHGTASIQLAIQGEPGETRGDPIQVIFSRGGGVVLGTATYSYSASVGSNPVSLNPGFNKVDAHIGDTISISIEADDTQGERIPDSKN